MTAIDIGKLFNVEEDERHIHLSGTKCGCSIVKTPPIEYYKGRIGHELIVWQSGRVIDGSISYDEVKFETEYQSTFVKADKKDV